MVAYRIKWVAHSSSTGPAAHQLKRRRSTVEDLEDLWGGGPTHTPARPDQVKRSITFTRLNRSQIKSLGVYLQHPFKGCSMA